MTFVCSKCILDLSFPNIHFDNQGVCNYCKEYNGLDQIYAINSVNKSKLESLINKIKSAEKSKEYDCILGVSGGRDSSYCLYLLKKWGLRPLAFTCDIKMNSDIANNNIKNVCTRLDVDLNTYTVDDNEYCDLQKSFFLASVPAIDTPQDHAIFTQLYRTAYENDIKYIFTGSSFRTEGPIPSEWSHPRDATFIKDIQRKFGTVKLKKYPLDNPVHWVKYRKKGMVRIDPLNYLEYIHNDVDMVLKNELGWEYYGGHHFESILTRWLHAYYLPVKFDIDKRVTDYSVLIRSNQLTRNEALKKMRESFYPADLEIKDRKFIMDRLDFDLEEMETLIEAPKKSNFDYRHNPMYVKILRLIYPRVV